MHELLLIAMLNESGGPMEIFLSVLNFNKDPSPYAASCFEFSYSTESWCCFQSIQQIFALQPSTFIVHLFELIWIRSSLAQI
jgi:hypothetical protein